MMSDNLQEQLKIEPGLTEAVRIVLKYEIQSLLSRLAETGEEYIVLTARTDERTCGHISSEKGEGFVHNTSLQNVKEEFLNYCTGDQVPKPVEKNPSQSLLPKQHRRKSTPRCKFQPAANDGTNTVYSQDQGVPFNGSVETLGGVEANTALDLSERKAEGLSTLPIDYSNDSISINSKPVSPENTDVSTPSNPLHESLPVDDVCENSDFHDADNKTKDAGPVYRSVEYSWHEEKFHVKSEDHQLGHGYSAIPQDNYNMKYLEGSNQNIQDDFVNGGSPVSAQMNNLYSGTSKPRKSRKSKGPVVRANHDEAAVTAGYAASPGFKDEFYDATYMPVHEDSDVKSENKMMHPGFTDMKSAFEEIGNMAKCLICDKILANKNNRTFHWRSHVGDKRYTCDICNKAFTHPSNMRSHRKIHTDEKPFPCELCERRFRRRDYLLQHLERFHYNPKQSETLVSDDSYMEASGSIAEANMTM